ncbi:hypothetical protein [Nocardioides sp. AN3]
MAEFSAAAGLAAQENRPSVTGDCRHSWHRSPEACPIHGCAECCLQHFDECGPYGIDIWQEPIAPATRKYRDKLPDGSWYDGEEWADELAGDLWESYVEDDGCRICQEINDRTHLTPLERHLLTCTEEYHCRGCHRCLRGDRICTSCFRCTGCAIGHCEDFEVRWSGHQQRERLVQWEAHEWWEVPA